MYSLIVIQVNRPLYDCLTQSVGKLKLYFHPITDVFASKGVKCNLKELDDVLMRDVGGKIKSDGRYSVFITFFSQILFTQLRFHYF